MSMPFNKRTQRTRKQLRLRTYLIASLVGIVIIGGGILTYRHFNPTKVSLKVQHAQEKTQEDQKKANVINGKAAGDDSSTSGNDTYTPPDDPSNITISTKEADQQVTVITKLTGYSDGTCTLTTTNGAQTNAQTVQVIFQAQFSTCAGFTIPTSALGTGTWNFNLSVTSGGITTNKTATLDVK